MAFEPPSSLTHDILFKIVFGSSDSVISLRALLNALLERPPDQRIKSLVIVNPSLEKEHMTDHGVVLDVQARDENNTRYNLEMQVARQAYLSSRIVYYLGTLHRQQLKAGEGYKSSAPSVVVCIVDHIQFPQYPDVIEIYELTGRRHGHVLTEHMQIHVVELPKFTKTSVDDLSSPTDIWLHVLRFAHLYVRGTDELPEKLTAEEGVAMAIDKMKHAMSSEEVRAWALSREKGQRDIISAIDNARDEGLEAGLVQKQQEIVRRMLADGLDVAVISRYTNLSPAEVESLRDA